MLVYDIFIFLIQPLHIPICIVRLEELIIVRVDHHIFNPGMKLSFQILGNKTSANVKNKVFFSVPIIARVCFLLYI